MDALQRIVEWIEANEFFERERTRNEKRAMGMLLYRAGLSFDKAGKFVGASHTSVWDWYHTGRELFASQKVRVKRKRIAVDEKELRIGGTCYYLWAAVDLDRHEVVEVMLTMGRSSLEALAFMTRVASLCEGEAPRIFIDGGV